MKVLKYSSQHNSVPVIALEFEDPYIDKFTKNGQIIAEKIGLGKTSVHSYMAKRK